MRLRNVILAGWLTWGIIGLSVLLQTVQGHGVWDGRRMVWLGCYLAFGGLFSLSTWVDCRDVALGALALQSVAGLVCTFLEPSGFAPVLLVIVAAEVGTRTPRFAMIWVVLQTAVFAAVLQRNAMSIAIALVYFAFQLFALFALHAAHSELHARQDLAEANAELKVTAGLLEINSRTSERLRIARELHDLLGHHLAALSLNLEVAGHLAGDAARDPIDKSKAITKLLLADVRDAVSTLREDEPVDLTAALLSLREVIATPVLHLDLGGELAIGDPAVAQVALRTVQEVVTNAVRHSGARNLWLRLGTDGTSLAIEARDDGTGSDQVRFGNGLRGIRERVEALRGSLDVTSARGHGFTVQVALPLEVR